MHNIKEIIKDLEKSDVISFDKSFEYAQICSSFLKENKNEAEGRIIVIHVLNNWIKINERT